MQAILIGVKGMAKVKTTKKKGPWLNILLTPDMHKKLKKAAAAEEVPMTIFLRKILREKLSA